VVDVAGGADDDGFHWFQCNESAGVFARSLFIIKVIYTCAKKQSNQVT
jgi:hypothetical protein